MRAEPTDAEEALWKYLRCKQLGVKFRRQQIIENYIVDFVCLEKQLIIEVDGKYHTQEDQQKSDATRNEKLKDKGFRIIRFSNEEVTSNTYQVIESIKSYLYEK